MLELRAGRGFAPSKDEKIIWFCCCFRWKLFGFTWVFWRAIEFTSWKFYFSIVVITVFIELKVEIVLFILFLDIKEWVHWQAYYNGSRIIVQQKNKHSSLDLTFRVLVTKFCASKRFATYVVKLFTIYFRSENSRCNKILHINLNMTEFTHQLHRC